MPDKTEISGKVGDRSFGTIGRGGDWVLTAAVWTAALLIGSVFFWILGGLLWQGWDRLSWTFFLGSPEDAGRAGGIGPILVSTFLILAVCLTVAGPIGLGAAIFLAECTSTEKRLGRWVGRSLDVLAGVPSIVFGLFGNALFCVYLGLGFSILSGGLTLTCMVLPILIRTTEEGFRAVPQAYRQAAAALGMSRTRTLFHILIPVALPGLLAGFVLGIGRAAAETAALIFTSGYVDRMPASLMDSGRALSVHIYDLSMNVPGGEPNAYASAVVLLGLLLMINRGASWASGWKPSEEQRR